MAGRVYPGLSIFAGQQAEAVRMLWDAIHTLREGASSLDVLTPTVAAQSYSPSVMQTELSGRGNYPLNVEGLLGVLADPQPMGLTIIPSTSSLPSGAGLAGYSAYAVVSWNGTLYYLDPSTNPPHWVVAVSSTLTVLSKTSTYVMQATDGDNLLVLCSGTFVVTLYTAVGNTGKRVTIKNVGSGEISIDGYVAETIDGAGAMTLPIKYGSITLVSNGTGWNSTDQFGNLTDGAALQVPRINAAGNGFEFATISSSPMVLLYAGNGTEPLSVGAKNLFTVAITGLTALDQLAISFSGHATGDAVATGTTPWNVTDGAFLATAVNEPAFNLNTFIEYRLRRSQASTVVVRSMANGVPRAPITLATAWTANWTLSMYITDVTGTSGAMYWECSVYKLAGQ